MEIISNGFFLVSIFLLPCLIFIFNQFLSNYTHQSPPFPPGPKPWPIVGNIFHLKNPLHISLTKLSQSYGPLMLFKLGNQNLIVGSSSSAAMEILKTQDRILSARFVPSATPISISDLNRGSIFWAEECNDGWKSIRTLLRSEMVSGKALDYQGFIRAKKVMDLIDFLRSKEGSVVNIRDLVYITVFNMISNVIMKRDFLYFEEKQSCGDDGLKLKGFFKEMTQIFSSPNLSDIFPFLSKFDLQGLKKRSKELSLKVLDIWDPIIQDKRRRDTSSNSQDFLDCLIKNGYTNMQINELLMVSSLSLPKFSTTFIQQK